MSSSTVRASTPSPARPGIDRAISLRLLGVTAGDRAVVGAGPPSPPLRDRFGGRFAPLDATERDARQ